MVYRSVRDCFRNVLSWFIYLVVFTALAKYPLLQKRNPYIEEKHFHY
jgi:hypothetical protein